jgi:hypothetical protein
LQQHGPDLFTSDTGLAEETKDDEGDSSRTRPGLGGGRCVTNEWISVEERLPEFPEGKNFVTCIVNVEGGHVMCFNWARHTHAKTAYGQRPRWEWWGRIAPWQVTHWMPLPEPPSLKARTE